MKSNEVHSMRVHVKAFLPVRATLMYKQKLTESSV